jgi:hypothetical protein
MDNLYIIIALNIAFLGVGFGIGQHYESVRGFTAREVERHHHIIMRMIPELNKHHTKEFIYTELIRDRERRHGVQP